MARRAHRERAEQITILAWQTEWIHVQTENKKRLPDLRSLLNRYTPKQSSQEQVGVLAAFGLHGRPRMNVRVKGEHDGAW